MTITFDTNILVYAYDSGAGERHDMARDLVERALARGNCVLTAQSLGEFYVAVTRKGKVTAEQAHDVVGMLRRMFPVVAADADCIDAAITVARTHTLQFWDTLLWATAERHGCTLLLSEDFQDGRRLGATLILNPFNAGNRVVLDAALPAVE